MVELTYDTNADHLPIIEFVRLLTLAQVKNPSLLA